MQYAMTLPLARRSPLVIPRRDLVLDSGDALTLQLTLVEADRPDAALLDLVGIGPRVVLSIWHTTQWCDYGLPPAGRAVLRQVEGTIQATPGRADVVLTRGALSGYGRRLGWTLQLDYGGDLSAIAWGALHLQSGAVLVERLTDLLTDDYAPVTDETPAVIEV